MHSPLCQFCGRRTCELLPASGSHEQSCCRCRVQARGNVALHLARVASSGRMAGGTAGVRVAAREPPDRLPRCLCVCRATGALAWVPARSARWVSAHYVCMCVVFSRCRPSACHWTAPVTNVTEPLFMCLRSIFVLWWRGFKYFRQMGCLYVNVSVHSLGTRLLSGLWCANLLSQV